MGWKSPKDREAYISKMREAGFDQADIDADVKAIDAEKNAPAPAPPPVIAPSSKPGGGGSPITQPETAAPSMAAAPAQSVQADLSSLHQARQDQGNSLIDQVINVENAKLIGYPLAAYGAIKLADTALEKSGLKARMFGQSKPIDRTIDIPLEATPDNKLPEAAQQKFSPKEAIIEAEINKKFPFTFQEAKKGLGLEGVTVVDPMQAQAVAKQYSNQLQSQAAAVQPTVASELSASVPEISKTVVPTSSTYEEMKPTYNKGVKNSLGPKAYNWLAGQEGPKAPEVWKNLVGNKNMSYDEFMKTQKPLYEAYIGSYGEPDPFKQPSKPGTYRAPAMIPEYIKGGASLGGLATAAGGSLAALGVMEAVKKGQQTGDWSDLAQFGVDTIAGAINPALLVGTHMEGLNTGEAEELAKKRYEGKVGGGRGIAPPSPRSQVGRR